ncbi:MAG: hypothetical protein LKI58_02150 [Actinomyces sp.]|jgi:hypothetical protein|nr:hypothetical protein [Actinomyces sp.]MCI1641237.1 hypothetical protein [Actinomyces sp.]MCI1662546.1 hypothetical protein [Actinomyces sp.]MCI1786858.1 hypothetical protein [Actinomyces sp.]MCI1829000.1 hypothetical protein [Actinomyces sp.]MCI1867262.1 hypothetical protein [Actinomyces sp.]
MSPTQTAPRKNRFGRTKAGGVPALRVAMPVGLLLALGLAAPKVMLGNPEGPAKWMAVAILAAFLAPCAIPLVWVLIVDRSTLPGALPHPEASVESAWYSRAAEDAFHATLVLCGLGAATAGLWAPESVSWTFVAVFAIAALSFAVSYLIRTHR